MPPEPTIPGVGEPNEGETSEQITLADRTATRNVPAVASRFDYGLPPAPSEAGASDGDGEPAVPFERPDLVPMGPSTTAMLIGRGLLVVAALLVGLAARRAAGSGSDRGAAFWPVTLSAAVFVVVGVAGLVFWCCTLAENARRLKARSATPRAVGGAWTLPIAWVVVSAVTYLRADVGGDLDPLPGVAAIGFSITLAVAYARVQGVLRGLSRRPPVVWVHAYPLDLFAFGLVWWRLTSWPEPVVVGDWEHVRLTSNIAFVAAAALALNALVFGWLALRGSSGVYERLGRLEARHHTDEQPIPAWFAQGLRPGADGGPIAPADDRPLIGVAPLTAVVAGFHLLWGVITVIVALVLLRTAFEYSDRPALVDGTLLVDDDDAALIGAVVVTSAIVYVLAIVVHGVWSVLTALNARRVTVHAPHPGSFGVVFVPMPVLITVGLLIGDDAGYVIVLVGLAFAFLALLWVNQMLMGLSSRLGGELRGFGRWTLLISVVYLIGVVENFLFGRAEGRLGFLATATLVQGALIVAGAVVGYRAMRALDDTLRNHRRAKRTTDLETR